MIELRPEEWGAVDSPVFQRLRSIRQLAMTHLVYPGTVHTRFEHSLGVRHVAGLLAAKLKIKDERQAVEAAALLHDVGHGPFSHVSEQVIDELAGVHGVHEAVSVFLMRNDEDLRSALGADLCDRAAEIVALEGSRTVERDIVSGPTDADKLDYLLRDSYFAGVKYGEYDLGKIIDSVRTIAPRSAQTQLGFEADGVWAVEGLLMARHHMHRQVYGHKTRLATDIMTTRALRAGVESEVLNPQAFRVGVDESGGRRRASVSGEFVEHYLDQTDERVLDQLAQADPACAAGDLARRLRGRQLLRQTVRLRLDERKSELGDAAYADILDAEVLMAEKIGAMEEKIAAELDVPAHLVAVYIDARSNPTYRNPSSPVGPKDVMVERDGSQPRLLQSESEIFRDQLGEEHSWAYLYTPSLNEGKEERASELLWQELSEN